MFTVGAVCSTYSTITTNIQYEFQWFHHTVSNIMSITLSLDDAHFLPCRLNILIAFLHLGTNITILAWDPLQSSTKSITYRPYSLWEEIWDWYWDWDTSLCIKSLGTISTNAFFKVPSQIITVHLDGFCEVINFFKSLFIISLPFSKTEHIMG